MLFELLKAKGIPCVLTREPGGTRIGEQIREILLCKKNSSLVPLAELFLYEADRAQHFEEVIRPSLLKGMWVISDRCFDATLAYQGTGRGLDWDLLRGLNQLASNGLMPDITFLIDCPPQIGLKRAKDRAETQLAGGGLDRFEREGLGFHQRVREAYINLAKGEKRFCILDGLKDPSTLHRKIVQEIRGRFDIGL